MKSKLKYVTDKAVYDYWTKEFPQSQKSNDAGEVIQSVKLSPSNGNYAVNIKAGEWHSVESLEPDSCILEVKQGPYVPHEVGGVLEV